MDTRFHFNKIQFVPPFVPPLYFATPVFGQKTSSLNLASHPGKLSTKSTDSISGEEKPAQGRLSDQDDAGKLAFLGEQLAQGRLSDQDAVPHPAAKPFLKLS